MAWRGIHISEPAALSQRQRSITVERKGNDAVRIPLEDVGWIVVDTPEAQFSSALLASCAEEGVAVVFTDRRHMPCGTLQPFSGNYAQAEVSRIQLAATGSLQRRIWRKTVRAKIMNQSTLLLKARTNNWRVLRGMAKQVKVGDTDNMEAQAARRYWSALFRDFRRDTDGYDRVNALLNYGYAVMRAAVARTLATAGLVPAVGIHHRSNMNPFNLADDVIEPFRPTVDWMAYEMREPSGWDEAYDASKGLGKSDRQQMAGVLTMEVRIENEIMNALNGIERCVASLVRSFRSGKSGDFQPPEFI